jgi:hypothetical protein
MEHHKRKTELERYAIEQENVRCFFIYELNIERDLRSEKRREEKSPKRG